MIRLAKYIFPFILVFITETSAFAQKIEVQLSARRISIDQHLQVNFVIEGNAKNFQAPAFSDFFVRSGPNTSSSIQIINGQYSQSLTYSYILQAKKTGTLAIEPASVSIGNTEYSSQSVKIEVLQSTQQTQQQQTQQQNKQVPDDTKITSAEDLFLDIELSKSNPYAGEQITVCYKIYTRVPVVNYQINEVPKFTGFWMQELESPQNVRPYEENYKGATYTVARIYKVQLFPQKSGELLIEPLAIEAVVRKQIQNKRRNPFDEFFNDPFFNPFQNQYKTEKYIVKSKALKIQVKPFPTNKPPNFSGLTGSFKLEVNTDQRETKTNEPITLQIKVSGKGNIKMIPPFDLDLPMDIETYEPKEKENISTQGDLISGSKTFDYLLIPRTKGEYRIPSIEFSYFDPLKKSYVELRSEPIDISVKQGKDDPADQSLIPGKRDIELRGKDIRFIRVNNRMPARKKEAFFNSVLYYLLLLSPFLLFFGVLLLRKQISEKLQNEESIRNKKAQKGLRSNLKKAEKHLKNNNKEGFYASLSTALFLYFSNKLNIPASEINKELIAEKLRNKNIEADWIKKIIDDLDHCDLARYAPALADSRLSDFYKSLKINLEKINKKLI
jgi:hypothetical protein